MSPDWKEEHAAPADKEASRETRPFVGVTFRCCRVYMRVYPQGIGAQIVHCPKCGGGLEIEFTADGKPKTFFEAE